MHIYTRTGVAYREEGRVIGQIYVMDIIERKNTFRVTINAPYSELDF